MYKEATVESKVNTAVEIYYMGGKWKEYLDAVNEKDVTEQACKRLGEKSWLKD